jgi:cob(I)alamin adenosyltransferase
MRICTKTGDKGTTSLLYGSRVKKNNLRIEACGALDELNSFLGLCKPLLKNRTIKDLIKKIQQNLFLIGSEIATTASSVYKLRKRINREDVGNLERYIEKLECKQKDHSFVIPGKNTLSATFDVARSVTRRVERRIVALKSKGSVKNGYILMYLNRLSDLLYLLARSYEKRAMKR